jgi:hypothetical protein
MRHAGWMNARAARSTGSAALRTYTVVLPDHSPATVQTKAASVEDAVAWARKEFACPGAYVARRRVEPPTHAASCVECGRAVQGHSPVGRRLKVSRNEGHGHDTMDGFIRTDADPVPLAKESQPES